MAKQKLFVATLFALVVGSMSAQTLDTEALASVHPSTAREVFGVSRYVKLDGAQQKALATAFEREDSIFVARIKADGGVLSVKGNREIQKMHDRAIASVLSDEQLEQYYRGVIDKEPMPRVSPWPIVCRKNMILPIRIGNSSELLSIK